MRLMIWLTLILLAILLVGFLLTNLDTRVPITIWATDYPGVHIFWVVLISVVVGFLFTAFIAFVEGARARLDNRKLRREVHKLETEINYLRTQPRPSAPPEPDALVRGNDAPGELSAPRDEFPSAPVYGLDEEEDAPHDPDDDVYTGGRAV